MYQLRYTLLHAVYVLSMLVCAFSGFKVFKTDEDYTPKTDFRNDEYADEYENHTTTRDYLVLGEGAQILDTSLCPWKEKIFENPNLSPAKITYAECLCKKCDYTFASPDKTTLTRLQKKSGCVPFTKDIAAYEHKQGRTILLTSLPVACICARRNTQSYHEIFGRGDGREGYDYDNYADYYDKDRTTDDPKSRTISVDDKDPSLSLTFDLIVPFEDYIARKKEY